jgi:hypothetical protein
MANTATASQTQANHRPSGHRGLAAYLAGERYDELRTQALLGKLLATVTRNSHRLLDLATIDESVPGHSSHDAGVQTVSICQIRGSEGRTADFDADFRPLRTHNRERWQNVAVAHQMGASLPPVELIQVDDTYFVRDGHHRVSVARAFGQEYIEAKVIVWRLSNPLLCQTEPHMCLQFSHS